MGRAKELAAAHWAYIEELLTTHGVGEYTIGTIGWHYRKAFEHGYKHGIEDCKEAESICETAQAYYTGLDDSQRTTSTLAVQQGAAGGTEVGEEDMLLWMSGKS